MVFLKEHSNDERRVSLTPGGVTVLRANGHEIIIEKGAGDEAKFSDHEYAEAGANIAYSTEDVFKQSELILKVAPISENEIDYLIPHQTIISALHLGNQSAEYFEALTSKSVTGIGYEFICGLDNEFPIVRMMHEITDQSLCKLQLITWKVLVVVKVLCLEEFLGYHQLPL